MNYENIIMGEWGDSYANEEDELIHMCSEDGGDTYDEEINTAIKNKCTIEELNKIRTKHYNKLE